MKQCMNSENLHRRLKKIIGQVQAIDRMIDEDVPCEDVLAQLNAAKREYYPVNDNQEPIVLVARDKEQPYVQPFIFNKHQATPREEKNNVGYLMQDYAVTLITNMLNARLNELLQVANPPYIYATTYDDDFFVAKTKAAFTGIVVC